jgi:hypothetical protein
MDVPVASLPTLDQLRDFVRDRLCAVDRLDPAQVQLRQALIRRAGRPCGLFFQVRGPRLMKTYAVWAGDEHRILFYNSQGDRCDGVRLSDAPDPLKLAGPAAAAA